MRSIEKDIADLVRAYKSKTGKFLTLGTVESATGGRVADKITNVAGSSDYFLGSIVSYSNDIKKKIVGVSESTLATLGAVSPETAREMAEGGCRVLNADICISTTGIAGPGGATPTKLVGLFYIGLATGGSTIHEKHIFSGSREEVKKKATAVALAMVREHLRACVNSVSDIPLEEKHVVTCFLEHDGLILILRRSQKVSTYQRSWAGVSGYIETEPLDQAYTEIREETSLFPNSLKLVKQGRPLEVIDKELNRKWVVHPFLFHVTDPERLKIDWEHTECKWIHPDDLSHYQTVPGLKKALGLVLD